MKDTAKFRQINEIEENLILNLLSDFSSKIIPFFKKSNLKLCIFLNDLNSGDHYLLVHLIHNRLLNNIKNFVSKLNLRSAGVYFGFIKKGNFRLSLEGADFLYKHNLIPDGRKLYINGSGEKAILYGNNIVKKMLINVPLDLRRNQLVLILNDLNEIIAIAKSEVDYETIQDLKLDEIIARNLIDKGYYLRKNQ